MAPCPDSLSPRLIGSGRRSAPGVPRSDLSRGTLGISAPPSPAPGARQRSDPRLTAAWGAAPTEGAEGVAIGAPLAGAGRRPRPIQPQRVAQGDELPPASGSKKQASSRAQGGGLASVFPAKNAPRRGANHKGAEPLFLILILWKHRRSPKMGQYPIVTAKKQPFSMGLDSRIKKW